MDYAALIAHHVEVGAEATIAVRTVPMEEASSFGTIHVDRDNRITGFEEKPEKPKSNLISMGIYIFSTKALVRHLLEITGAGGGTDFGHHIFPAMLAEGSHLAAYVWDGYWEDVGTVQAYFDANMDLIDPEHPLNIRSWSVRTNLDEHRVGDRAAGFICPGGSIRRSYLSRGCRIEGDVVGSVLGPGVVVEAGARVRASILMHDGHMGRGAALENVVRDKLGDVGAEARIGKDGPATVNQRFPSHLDSGISLIGKAARIPSGATLGKNVVVFPKTDLGQCGITRVESGDTVDALDSRNEVTP